MSVAGGNAAAGRAEKTRVDQAENARPATLREVTGLWRTLQPFGMEVSFSGAVG
jgi:hypothetical protein